MPLEPLPPLVRFTLLAAAIIAGMIDIRTRRIPNWLTLPGVLIGLILNTVLLGRAGLFASVEGAGLALLIYLPLWLLRGMGAGDVKLMLALGAFAGPPHWFALFLASSILGAAAGLYLAFRNGRLGQTLWNTLVLAKELLLLRSPSHNRPELDYRHDSALKLPHGTVIAVAAMSLALAGWL